MARQVLKDIALVLALSSVTLYRLQVDGKDVAYFERLLPSRVLTDSNDIRSFTEGSI
jgi:hypothetical protein